MTDTRTTGPAVEIPTAVTQLLMEQLGVGEDEITLDCSLRDDLGADSLDVVEVAIAFDEMFDIEISDETLASWHTAPLSKVIADLRAAGAKL